MAVFWFLHVMFFGTVMDLNIQRYRVYVSGLRGAKVGRKNKEILTGVWFPETITINV